ncbi:MAG TPA: CHASE2 domain-containing protein [Gemmatimonadetes bacterium]|nr:CHASE2 domain-containing protein [Gemmatimonadota bacterium]
MGGLKSALRGKRLQYLMAFAMTVVFVLLRTWDPLPLQLLRLKTFDMYQRAQPRETIKHPVAIIDLDEESLAAYGQWPWPRTLVAELVTKLMAQGVAVIGFDMVVAAGREAITAVHGETTRAVINNHMVPLAAFAGALLAIVLVFRVATATGRAMDVRVLLLAGVVIAAFFSACIAFILSMSSARTVQNAVMWSMGSLRGASWQSVLLATVYTVPAAAVLIGLARPLNLMAIGEETANYLGADVEGVKRTALVIAALITAAGVAVAGVIGFVGLVVPHGVRLLIGSDHRALLPLSFLGGAAFLTLADLIARLALRPVEIPIGVITAFVGVPIFLVLLRRSMGPSLGGT